MPRGRKPRAISVQEASGAYRKDPQRRPTSIVKAASDAPVAPSFISEDPNYLPVWDEVCAILQDQGILSSSDSHLIVEYVVTYVEWVKCAQHIREHGHMNDEGKTSPQSVAFFKLAAQHAKLLPELGLSPSGRARLSNTTASTKPENALTSFLSERLG